MRRSLALTTALTAFVAALAASVQAKPAHPVLAFYAEWDQPGSVQFDKITHLLLAFSLPNNGGSISGYVPGGIVSQAHSAGVKVMASIGGVNNSAPFPSIAGNAGSRTTFANNIKSLLDGNNLDGVDIDWEFPASTADSGNYTLMLKAIRSAIGSKLISLDVAPDGEKGQFIGRGATEIADYFNVMAYDYTGNFPGSLVGQHAPYAKATVALSYWRVRGVPKENIILGLPFYGKDFNQGGNAVPYSTIMAQNPGLSPDADSVGRTYFNGVTTIKKKATYVAQNAYGGVMIWEMAQDASGSKSLLDALNSGLLAPVNVILAGRGDRAGNADRNAFGFAGKTMLTLTGTRLTATQANGFSAADALGRGALSAGAGPNVRSAAGVYFTNPAAR